MKNAYAIISISRQLCKTGELIESIASGIQDTEQGHVSVSDLYEGLLMDEVEHVQVLALELTKMLIDASDESAVNNDEGGGSVFGPGELTVEKAAPADPDDTTSPETDLEGGVQ